MSQYYGLLVSAVGVASSCKPVLAFYQQAQALPIDGFVLWKQLETLQSGLDVCARLSARHETRQLVIPAIALCRVCLQQCELFLKRDNDDEDDARPNSAESWTNWFGKQKDGVTRQTRVKELTVLVVQCMQTINLAIASANTLHPNHIHKHLGNTLQPGRSSYEEAYNYLQQREMRRWTGEDKVLCAGNLYERAVSSAEGGKVAWSLQGRCIAVLRVSGETVSVGFEPETGTELNYDDVDSFYGQIEKDTYEWVPNATATFERIPYDKREEKLGDLLDNTDTMTMFYEMGNKKNRDNAFGLEFESANEGISLEMFEAVVALLMWCDAGAVALADIGLSSESDPEEAAEERKQIKKKQSSDLNVKLRSIVLCDD